MADRIAVDDLTEAILSLLQTTGFDIGDNTAPDSPSFPYAVLYSIGDTERSGDMARRSIDAVEEYQVTSVGETRRQAQAMGDRVRSTVTKAALVAVGVSGRKINYVDPTHEGIERDEDRQPPLFYSIDTFQIQTTPS